MARVARETLRPSRIIASWRSPMVRCRRCDQPALRLVPSGPYSRQRPHNRVDPHLPAIPGRQRPRSCGERRVPRVRKRRVQRLRKAFGVASGAHQIDRTALRHGRADHRLATGEVLEQLERRGGERDVVDRERDHRHGELREIARHVQPRPATFRPRRQAAYCSSGNLSWCVCT